VDAATSSAGAKIFASLAGAADYHGVLCTLDRRARPSATALPGRAGRSAGVQVVGDWDALGMRGTVSRTLLLDGRCSCPTRRG